MYLGVLPADWQASTTFLPCSSGFEQPAGDPTFTRMGSQRPRAPGFVCAPSAGQLPWRLWGTGCRAPRRAEPNVGPTGLPGRGKRLAAVWLFCLSMTLPARGQLLDRPIVLSGARIITMAGPIIERGTIVIKGSRIKAIGPDVKAPFFARTLDVSGKVVTPGFIDSYSALGRLGGAEKGDPTATAWDGFDRYARDDFREALSHGVTAVYVEPVSAGGVAGTGVVVRLAPAKGKSAGLLLDGDNALAINLGSGQSAIARLKTLHRIRSEFKKALEYRKSLEDYEEDLKEYLEKLEERRKKEEAEDEENGDDKEEAVDDEPSPAPDEEKDEEGEEEGSDEKGRPASWGSLIAAAGESGDNDDDKEKSDGDDDKKKDEEEELKKPTRPTPDRKSEVLLKAIDRKLPVRIEAHRSEDILNAVELAEEFTLDVVLQGATDAYLVADRLAKADIPVVLGPVARSSLFQDNEYRRHTSQNAAVLDEAGVQWTVGSGGRDPGAARFVGMNAQLAAGHGAAQGNWLRTVTSGAAQILGVEKRIGKLARGMEADLVVWSGDPSDPASKVERVYVAGKLVYRR